MNRQWIWQWIEREVLTALNEEVIKEIELDRLIH